MTAASRFILSLGPDSFRTNEAMKAARECARYVESNMTDPAAREKLLRIATDHRLDHFGTDGTLADRILSAFPHLGAPTEDVVEAARTIALRKWCGRFIGLAESKELEADIADLVTVHAARERADEREACAKVICDDCRIEAPLHEHGWHAHPQGSALPVLIKCKAAAIRARP